MVQYFKGDSDELKIEAVGKPVFDLTTTALDQFYAGAFDCNAFLLQLYDERRMPFSERINRDAFIQFIKEALVNFPFIGTFESYMFILRAVFGSDADILFSVPAPGKLGISVDTFSELSFDFIVTELVDGIYEEYNLITSDGDEIILTGVSGIQTEYALQLLFSEIMPAGITPTISLDFVIKSFWIVHEGVDYFDIVDHDGNSIIFTELGA